MLHFEVIEAAGMAVPGGTDGQQQGDATATLSPSWPSAPRAEAAATATQASPPPTDAAAAGPT